MSMRLLVSLMPIHSPLASPMLGPIPPQLGALAALLELRVGNNNLSGESRCRGNRFMNGRRTKVSRTQLINRVSFNFRSWRTLFSDASPIENLRLAAARARCYDVPKVILRAQERSDR